MPTYDYVCEACGKALELFQAMSESPKRKCPECGKLKLQRQIGAGAGIIFKGSGFYQTDYRSDSYKKGAQDAEQKASPKKEDAKGDKSTKKSSPSDKKKSKDKD